MGQIKNIKLHIVTDIKRKLKKIMSVNGDVEMLDESQSEKVAILDAGAQYGKVIDRRVRELFIETVILPLNTSAEELKKRNIRAIIVSGGPGSVSSENSPNWDQSVLTCGIPILGICYGLQLINRDLGGEVALTTGREDGQCIIQVDTSSLLFSNLQTEQEVLLTHGDSCVKAAPGASIIAKNGDKIVGLADPDRKIYGVQFHPEVDLTPSGKMIFNNFLIGIAGMQASFTLSNRESQCIEELKRMVGPTNKVLSLVSGGVDSAVCTALLFKAIGRDRVVAVHIDNGFLRKNESSKVKESLEKIGLNLHVFNEKHQFFHGTTRIPTKLGNNMVNVEVGPLHSVVLPEEKRKIIGDTFMKVSDNIMKKLNLDPETTLLAQGTLRPDLIESASHLASENANTIKTHHNDSMLVRKLREKGRVVEPLRDFHKDEVRLLGKELGLPDDLVQRHPFPGPGLAIRVICAEEKYVCKNFSEICNLLVSFVITQMLLKSLIPSYIVYKMVLRNLISTY